MSTMTLSAPPAEFTIARNGQVPLNFEGWLLAETSSRKTWKWDKAQRWSEVRIWRTVSDQWVVETAGMSDHPGEDIRQRVTVTDTPDGVLEALKHPGSRRVQGNFYDALVAASDVDRELRPALTERI